MIGTVSVRALVGDLLRAARARVGLARPRGEDWHRRGVGGRWDELGTLQLEFLKEQGLRPEHVLLDVGCGSLRGGVRFIDYLEPGHYWGIEKQAELLEAGRDVELSRAGVAGKEPHLRVTGLFELDHVPAGVAFDFALAQSVFTHLRPELVRLCIERVTRRLAPGGVFYATFFEGDEDVVGPSHGWREDELQHPRYRRETLRRLADEAGADLAYVGAWGHPRDQRMVAITPRSPVDAS